ncbi:hypothetical protein [Streptomyces sp. NPDC052015]
MRPTSQVSPPARLVGPAMGSLNDNGSVTCWSAYGDLHEALRGL